MPPSGSAPALEPCSSSAPRCQRREPVRHRPHHRGRHRQLRRAAHRHARARTRARARRGRSRRQRRARPPGAARAPHRVAGIVTTAVGITFFAVGAFLTIYSLRDVRIACEGSACDGPNHPDTAIEWPLGIALSAVGDASWLAGSFVWSYGSGMRGGVAEARGALRASLSGLSGTF
jgi:hypothetical protein